MLTGCMLGTGIRLYRELEWYQGQTGFYYTKNTLTREQLDAFWENALDSSRGKVEDVVLFKRTKGKKIEKPDLNRSVKAELVEAAGNMHLIVPGRLMSGSFVTDSDRKGCVISKKTADTLFGSYEVTGETIFLDGQPYMIRGIVDLNSQLCMIQGTEKTAYPFMRTAAPGLPVSAVQQMFTGILPRETGWMAEGDLYLGIAGLFLWMPAWVVLSAGIFLCRRGIRRLEMVWTEWKYKDIALQALKTVLPVAAFAGICGLLLVSLHFTDDYIPTSWSDFSFWTQLVQDKWGDFLRLVKNPLQIADAAMLGHLAGVACSFTVSSFLLAWIFQTVLKKGGYKDESLV